jgi:sugar lactone lactonase YvrE
LVLSEAAVVEAGVAPATPDTIAASLLPPVRHPVEALYEEAVAAAGRSDWPAYLSAVERAQVAAPGHPALERRRAEALAQLGRLDEAVAVLRGLAGWGVKFKLEDNELLAPLRSRGDWAEIASLAAASLTPAGATTMTFAVPRDDLIPEGIAWDPKRDVFYVGSVAQRKIVRVDRAGEAVDLIVGGQYGYLAGLGLAVDAARDRLWAVSMAPADDPAFDAATVGRSAVHVFDLSTGALVWSWTSRAADAFGFNDVCVLPDGGAVVSASDRGLLLRFGAGGGAPAAVTAPGAVPAANGLCLAPDGKHLYVSAWGLGIMRVGLEDGAVEPASVPGAGFTSVGVDGLYCVDGGLLAVQNYGGLDRVARFTLRDDGLIDGCRVLVSRQPLFVDPTTGAPARDGFHFIANSYVTPFSERKDKAVMTGFGTSSVMRVDQ